MAELVDALGSGPSGSNPVRVQVSLRVKVNSLYYKDLDRPKMPRVSRMSANPVFSKETGRENHRAIHDFSAQTQVRQNSILLSVP